MGVVKYKPASQKDDILAVEMVLEVMDNSSISASAVPRTKCYKCPLYSCYVGLIFIVAAVISVFAMKPIVENQILENFAFFEGGQVFENWKKPPVHPTLSIRIFNLTNLEGFLSGREAKPILNEIGPYVYRQNLEEVDNEFSPDGSELTFKDRKYYFFAAEISHGTEDDHVIVPNIPLFSVFKAMRNQPDYVKSLFRVNLESFDFAPDKEPFLRLTVKQFLWGYQSLLLGISHVASEECHKGRMRMEMSRFDQFGWEVDGTNSPDEKRGKVVEADNVVKNQGDNKSKDDNTTSSSLICEIQEGHLPLVGLFVGRNGTHLDSRTIRTGQDSIWEKGTMIKWHGKKQLDYWLNHEKSTTSKCNEVVGNEPSQLPLNLQKSDSITTFVGQVCRKIEFKYQMETSVGIEGEIRTYRFVAMANSFSTPEQEPSNICYCLSEPCLPTGLLDTGGCIEGSPILISWPHFLHGDPLLLESVVGVRPIEEKHMFFMDIQPTYGIAMTALARLQMNLIIENDPAWGYFENITQDKIYYPSVWVEDGITNPSRTMLQQVELLLNLPRRIQIIIGSINLALGLLLLLPEIYFWLRSCCYGQQKNVDNGGTAKIVDGSLVGSKKFLSNSVGSTHSSSSN